MTWFLIGLLLGGTFGALGMAIVASGSQADLSTENALLRSRIARLSMEHEHA